MLIVHHQEKHKVFVEMYLNVHRMYPIQLMYLNTFLQYVQSYLNSIYLDQFLIEDIRHLIIGNFYEVLLFDLSLTQIFKKMKNGMYI